MMLHHRERHLRWILLGMMHRIVGHHSHAFVEVLTASIQVSIEARKVAARYLDANAMPGREEVAGRHRLERNLVHLARFRPYWGLVVSVAIAEPLDGLIQVVGSAVGIYVQHLHREVGVLRVRRYVERDVDGATYFSPFF